MCVLLNLPVVIASKINHWALMQMLLIVGVNVSHTLAYAGKSTVKHVDILITLLVCMYDLSSWLAGACYRHMRYDASQKHSYAGRPISDFRTSGTRPDHLVVLRGSGQNYGVTVKLRFMYGLITV